MAKELSCDIEFSELDLRDLQALSRKNDELYGQAVGILREIALTRDHLNSRFQKAILEYCVNNKTDVDMSSLPILYLPIEIKEQQGVIVGFSPILVTKLTNGRVSVRLKDLKSKDLSGDKANIVAIDNHQVKQGEGK